MTEPLVSAIVLSHDAGHFLGEALESVRTQTHQRIELIWVHNGPAGDGPSVAAEYDPDVTVAIQPNRGICAGRDAGLAVARGELIAFLDGDDTWEPRRTELMLAALAADPSLDLVLGHVEQFVDPVVPPEVAKRLSVREEVMPARMLSAMLAPRKTFDRVGPWHEDLERTDGLVWFMKARDLGMRERLLEDVVLRRRVHGANTGLQQGRDMGEYARTLKQRLDLRRGAAR